MTDDQPSQPRPEGAYRAFLSYSRADNRLADWLHRVLEAYRTSRELVDVRGRKLPPRIARLAQLNVEARENTPDEFRVFVASEMEKWGRVVREANIKLG